jgi:hypothetical protein
MAKAAKVAKYFGIVVLGVVLLFAFVVNFSSVESRFQCSGKLSDPGFSKPSTVYIKVAMYRWWVHLWSESDAALWLEIPNEALDYFGHVIKVGDQLQIYGFQKDIKCHFSTLSNALGLSTAKGFFEGTCKRISA